MPQWLTYIIDNIPEAIAVIVSAIVAYRTGLAQTTKAEAEAVKILEEAESLDAEQLLKREEITSIQVRRLCDMIDEWQAQYETLAQNSKRELAEINGRLTAAENKAALLLDEYEKMKRDADVAIRNLQRQLCEEREQRQAQAALLIDLKRQVERQALRIEELNAENAELKALVKAKDARLEEQGKEIGALRGQVRILERKQEEEKCRTTN